MKHENQHRNDNRHQQNNNQHQPNESKPVAEQPKAETAVVAEQPKAAAPAPAAAPTISKTPVKGRLYILKTAPTMDPKGKQRQIVLNILKDRQGKPIDLAEMTELATKAGLQAVGGVGPSCNYHLHHLQLAGIVEVVNPTTAIVAEPVAETVNQ